MSNNKPFILIIVALSIILNACAVSIQQQGTSASANLVDPNSFSTPSSDQNSTEPGERIIPGVTGFGVRSDQEPDELGHYFLYEGGEMHMRIALSAQALETHGVGVLVFLDGTPQPYWTLDNNVCQYMHIFYPSDGDEKTIYELIFTPITGQSGETLEVGLQCVTAPHYFTGDCFMPFDQTDGNGQMLTRLKFNVDHSEVILPPLTQKVLSTEQEYVDMTSDELGYWSGSDAMEKIKWIFSIDGVQNACNRTGYAGEPVDIKLEIMGNPSAKFSLAIFVNHEPVCITDAFQLDLHQGQKTILTATLDMSDFDDQAVIYAVLVPRNCRIDSLQDPSCYISATSPSYYSR